MARPCFISLSLLFALSFAQTVFSKSKEISLNAGEGAVVFMMDSNYPNFPGNKLRVVFKKVDSLEIQSVLAQRKGKVTIKSLPAGIYRIDNFQSAQYKTTFKKSSTFAVEEGKATYIGDIEFKVNLGYGRNWRIDTLAITDNSTKTLGTIASRFKGDTSTTLQSVKWEHHATTNKSAKTTKFKVAGKKYKGENLDKNGLLVVRLASKKPNLLLQTASLGAAGHIVGRLEFDFESKIDSHRIGTIKSTDYNVMTGYDYKGLDKHTRGAIVTIELPPGEYSITRYRAHIDNPNAMIDYHYNTVAFNLPFNIEAGQITYLGEIYGNQSKKTVLIFDSVQSVNFYVNDFWDRDRKELVKRYPFLKGVTAKTELLEANDGWEQVFIQNVDPREILNQKQYKSQKAPDSDTLPVEKLVVPNLP